MPRRRAAPPRRAPLPGAPVYQIDPGRFARSSRSRRRTGDLAGVAERIEHVASLGAGAIALGPVFDPSSPDRIDPQFGGVEAFGGLARVAASRGLGIVLEARMPADAARRICDGPRAPLFRWMRLGATGLSLAGAVGLGPDACARITDAVHAAGGRDGVTGEIRGFAREWLEGGTLDGVTNFVFRATVIALVRGEIPPAEAGWVLDRLAAEYPRDGLLRSWTALGSSDHERLATLLGEDIGRLRLALTLQYAFPGVPVIRWGDEVGLTGAEADGQPMPWAAERWNPALLDLHRKLAELRQRWPALARGGYQPLCQPGEPEILAFARTDADPRRTVVCVANPNARRTSVRLLLPLPGLEGQPLRDVLADRQIACREGFIRIELEQWDVALLVPEGRES